MSIQSCKSVRWLENFLQPVEFSFSLLKQNHGRISTSDAERSGRPKEVTSQEIIDKIHDIVLKDRQL